MEVGADEESLLNAIQKSHGAQHEWLIRTIALACLQYGFGAAPSGDGYVLKPVNRHRHQEGLSWRNSGRVNHLLLKVEIIQKHPRDLTDGSAAQHLPAYQNTEQTPQAVPAITQTPAAFAAPYVMVGTPMLATTVRNMAKSAGRMGVDCEGCSLSRHGRLCLVQVMTGGTCYMFDVFQAGLGITCELKSMLEDDGIVKVMHDCRQDSAALYYQMGIKVQNIFDTQVAHGLVEFWDSIIDANEARQERIGLGRLLTKHGLAEHSSKQAVQDRMRRDPMLWSKRPIAQDLLQYAAEDVLQLLMLADKLTAELGKAELKLLSRLSAAYSQWYWDPAHTDGVATSFKDNCVALDNVKSGSWIVQLLQMARRLRVQ